MPGLLAKKKSDMATVEQADVENYSDKENSEVYIHDIVCNLITTNGRMVVVVVVVVVTVMIVMMRIDDDLDGG